MRTYHGRETPVKRDNDQENSNCRVCGKVNKLWNCEVFQRMNIENRWVKAKEAKLCFRCLKSNHIGSKCRFQGKCGINGCEKTHNRLLHRDMVTMNANAEEFQPATSMQTLQCNSANTCTVALRTIPVILKVKNKELKINALLDDGSTKSYINEDIASELGISGEKSLVEVTVINGKAEKFETACVSFLIQSESGNLTMSMEAQTTKNVTGRLKPIDWQRNSQRWNHLRGINFPKLGKKSKVDLLIGLDYVELHRLLGEMNGETVDPVARLTPLGWTCVGPIEKEETSFFTFHTAYSQRDDQSLQRFWEVENEGIQNASKIAPKDQEVLEKVEKSIKFTDGRYEVSLPWKQRQIELPNNYEMAKKRLESTEKRLEKDVAVKELYKSTI